MHDNARGGNDTLIGGANAINDLVGDARVMYDNARGGNDTLIGGGGEINDLYGDAYEMHDNARGGERHADWRRSVRCNCFYGDAYSMSDNAVGGNDTLIGGDNAPQLPLRRCLRHVSTTRAAAMTR